MSYSCSVCGGTERYKNGDCKACAKARAKRYAAALKLRDPERYTAQNKERARRNYPKTKEGNRARQLMDLYGLSVEDYMDKLRAQNYRCFMCGKHQADFKNWLAVDHCHKTGKVRALLCPKCNNAVAAYENHKDQIENYLKVFK